jgi:small-conductance mechanosensitive channel
MYLAILKPFQPGDMVDMALVKGFVRSVGATQTILDQPDTKIISSPFTNFTGEQKRARERQKKQPAKQPRQAASIG